MDTSATGIGFSSPLDWLLCLVALLAFIKPRFDQWPTSTDTVQPAGKPRDYIHWARYVTFVGLYLGSFMLLVMVVRMIPMATQVITGSNNPLAGQVSELLGEHSMIAALVIALAALANKQVAAVDERWRACLLNLARIPHETVTLRDRIRQHLPQLAMSGDAWESILSRLAENSPQFDWPALPTLPADDPRAQAGLPLLRALYVVQCIRTFELSTLDNQTVSSLELRLEEITAMLPTRWADNDKSTLNDYRTTVKAIVQSLTEILARLCVQYSADAERRNKRLQKFGFEQDFTDCIGMNILTPTSLCLLIISVVSLLTLMAALHAFDLLGIPTPEFRQALAAGQAGDTAGLQWFNLQRIVAWGSGAALSYSIAIAIGVVLGASVRRQAQTMSLPGCVLAVAVATLGSCVYFFFHGQGNSTGTVRPHLIWLALAFGLMAMVVIRSLLEDVENAEHVQQRARTLALQYGLACAVLYALLYVSANINGGRGITPTHLAAFVSFGFLRGGLLAWLVSLVIMDYVHRHINGARRRFPRFSLRQKLQGSHKGAARAFFIRDISEQGALMQMPAEYSVNPGDAVSLQFDNDTIDGTVVWNRKNLAGVKFNVEQRQLSVWQTFIRQRLTLAPG